MNASFDNFDQPEIASSAPVSLNEELAIVDKPILPNKAEEIDPAIFFTMAIAQQISDIHLRINQPPTLRRNGKILHTRLPILTSHSMQRFARWLIPDSMKPFVTKRHDLDFATNFQNARLRVNLLYELGHLAFSIRIIPTSVPSIKELGLPKILLDFTKFDHGLVLITGSAGSGKSTTLASLLNYINHQQAKHIITLEDPVEFIYSSSRGIVTQRQLGIDTPSFPEGIKYALRQDPDVMLIGEMRDRETALSAITAAETGVLVFSTLHTSDAIQTIHRIINLFEPGERDNIRMQLANVLRGTIAQKLYHRADTSGRSAVAEVLMMTSTIRDYLLKNQIDEIYALMDEGRFEGMQTLNHALLDLLEMGYIAFEEAIRTSNNPAALQQKIKGAFHGATLGN